MCSFRKRGCLFIAMLSGLSVGCGVDPLLPGGEDPPGAAQSLAKHQDALTHAEAYHLLRRATFGASPDAVERAVAMGLGATLDELLAVQASSSDFDAYVESFEFNIPKRWIAFMLEGPNPLNERMSLFWHDRFATSGRVAEGGDLPARVGHYEMLRRNALGNYRQFLEELTLDPLMLIWLDGANSPKSNPNENYTREFWELFTLGRDVLYTEDDIKEGARAFTGTTLLRQGGPPRTIFDLQNHDETEKLIFPGRAGAANHDYESVIDLTLAQPEAARYVARNLFVCFVHDHPNEQVVQQLADQFAAGGFEIAPLVRTILESEAFFSEEASGNQITSPVEHVVGVLRTLDTHLHSEDSQGFVFDRLVEDLAGAGQALLNPAGVNGWKEDDGWLEDQWILYRARALWRTFEYGPERQAGLPYHLLPATHLWDSRETRPLIVQAMADVFQLELTPEEFDHYIAVLDQDGYTAFNLINPDDQPRYVREMIRLMAMDERVAGR